MAVADRFYERPSLGPNIVVRNLSPQHQRGIKLEPETIVTVIHRGDTPIEDKYDAVDYVIEPGYVDMPYGAALHFQARAVVPGSRIVAATGRSPDGIVKPKQASFLGILNVDPPEKCRPFTEAECAAFDLNPEAVYRAPGEVVYEDARLAMAHSAVMNEVGIDDVTGRSSYVENDPAGTALQPPRREDNVALQDIAADEAAVASERAQRAREHAEQLEQEAARKEANRPRGGRSR